MTSPVEPLEPRRLLSGSGIVFPADAGVIDVTQVILDPSDPTKKITPDDDVDDTALLQTLINRLTPSGKIVYFPDGQYDISDQLFLEKLDFETEAEALNYDPAYWQVGTDGSRTYIESIQSGKDPAGNFPDPAAPVMTYSFEAFAGTRRFRVDGQASGGASDSFYWRLNGGEWRLRNLYTGSGNWFDRRVVADNLLLVDGTNTLDIVPRDVGLRIDAISLDYPDAYLNDVIFQGQSEEGTVFKLEDNLLDAGGNAFDGAIIAWDTGVEQFFRTGVRNLTLDVGSGNPEADGLRFHGNNQSTISDVTIRAAAGSGDVGLDLVHSAGIGPILVQDLTVDGFDVGIHTGWVNGSRTFDDITIRNQTTYGWVNEASSQIFVRGLESENAVPVFHNAAWRLPGDGQGRVTLLDGDFVGLAGASTERAIYTVGQMYARNISVTGYDVALFNGNQEGGRGFNGNDGIDEDYIGEYWSWGTSSRRGGGLFTLFDDAPDTGLGLPIKATPTVPWDALTSWASPGDHVIETSPGVFSGIPNDGIDDSASIQAAIDSGASTVYIPQGTWNLENDIELRGSVHRFIGTEGILRAPDFNTSPPKIVVGTSGPDTVVVERMTTSSFGGESPRFEHASDRTLVFSNITGFHYRPTVAEPGDVYINDVTGPAIKFQGGQNVWARQLNIEEDTTLPDSELDAKIVNDNANVWVLGFKTEKQGVHVTTINGGRTEMLGNHQNNNFGNTTPQYVTIDSALSSFLNIRSASEPGTTYGTVEETRDGVTRTGTILGHGYAGFSSEQLYDIRREIIVDNDDAGAVFTGTWSSSTSFPRGYIGDDFTFADNVAANSVTYTPTVPSSGEYEVFARWIGDWGGQNHSNHARSVAYDIVHDEGTDSIVVDQDFYSDGWYSLGTFKFEAGTSGTVTLTGDGDGGKINTDGIRFLQVSERRRIDEVVRQLGYGEIDYNGTDQGRGGTGLRLLRGGEIVENGQDVASVWKIRNVENFAQTVTLQAIDGSYDEDFLVPARTQIYVTNTAFGITHRLLLNGVQVHQLSARTSVFTDNAHAYVLLTEENKEWLFA
ncbi:MAG: glycosyl hydrolase family 28-related protein [Planctomycetota bacterium]